MGLGRLVQAAFGRNMTVKIDRASMDRMLDTMGRISPDHHGEQIGLLGVQRGGNGDHIAMFQDIPPQAAAGHMIFVDHDVMNRFVKHTLEPRGMAVGGMIHSQTGQDPNLSRDDLNAFRGYMQSFKQYYGADTPAYFLAPVMHFDNNRIPRVTTWVFDSRHPNAAPFEAKLDVTTRDGRRMEANAYSTMRTRNDPNLERAFDGMDRRQ